MCGGDRGGQVRGVLNSELGKGFLRWVGKKETENGFGAGVVAAGKRGRGERESIFVPELGGNVDGGKVGAQKG